jgi:hypothetical protein
MIDISIHLETKFSHSVFWNVDLVANVCMISTHLHYSKSEAIAENGRFGSYSNEDHIYSCILWVSREVHLLNSLLAHRPSCIRITEGNNLSSPSEHCVACRSESDIIVWKCHN